MLRFLLAFIISCTFALVSKAQNLVPNPSFEEYTDCPEFPSQLSLAKGWTLNINTADYYNACSSVLMGVPTSSTGFQYPVSGNAYAGFIPRGYNLSGQDAREYFGTKLITPLTIGTKYYVTFYVNLADGSPCGVNRIGVLFTNLSIGDTVILPAPLVQNISQVYTNTIITDEINWTKISGSFVADSAYGSILIGLFFENSLIDTLDVNQGDCIPYYFVDDVCVSKDSLACSITSSISHLTKDISTKIYPNPASQKIHISIEGEGNYKFNVALINSLGEILKIKEIETKEGIDISDVPHGSYIVQMQYLNQFFRQRLIIIH